MSERIRVRLNYTTREIEVEGPRNVVDEYLDKFNPLGASIMSLELPSAGRVGSATGPPEVLAPPERTPLKEAESFGEFFHQFPPNLSGNDQALVAGYFAQLDDVENRSFNTRQVSALLVEQNIKLANPSVALRRNVESRRMFVMTKGLFRVSERGITYLDKLRTEENSDD